MATHTNLNVIPGASRNFDQFPNSAIIRPPVVITLFMVSPATMWQGVRDGSLPRPVKHFKLAAAGKVLELRRGLLKPEGLAASRKGCEEMWNE